MTCTAPTKPHPARLFWTAAAGGALTLLLGLWRLGEASLWLDETFTVADARRSWSDIVLWRSDRGLVHPPLYYLLIKAVMTTCGTSEWCLRMPSVVCGALATGMVVTIAGRCFGISYALATALVTGPLPYALKYAQQARHYPLVALLSSAALMLAIRAHNLDNRGSARWPLFAALGVTVAALAWTHLFALAFIAALAAWCLLWQLWPTIPTSRPSWRCWGIAAATTAVLCAPLVALLWQRWAGATAEHFSSRWGPVENLSDLMLDLITLATRSWWVAGAVVVGLWHKTSSSRRLHLSLVTLCVIPLGVVALRNPEHFVPLRYFMPSVMVMSGCVAIGWASLGLGTFGALSRWMGYRRWHAPVSMLTVAMTATFPAMSFAGQLRKHYAVAGYERWSTVAEFLRRHADADDLVVPIPYEFIRSPFVAYPIPQRLANSDTVDLADALAAGPQRVFVVCSHIDRPQRAAHRRSTLQAVIGAGYRRDTTIRTPSDRHIEVLVYRRRWGPS